MAISGFAVIPGQSKFKRETVSETLKELTTSIYTEVAPESIADDIGVIVIIICFLSF